MESTAKKKGMTNQTVGKSESLSQWLDGLLCRTNTKVLIAFLVLLVVPIFQPDTLAHLGDKTFIHIWRTWRLVSCIIILSIFFFVGRKNLFVYLTVLFALSVLVSTITNKGSINEWVYRWIPVIAAVALVATLYNRRLRELIIVLFLVTFGMSVINLVSVFLFPEGTYGIVEGQPGQRFFFGNRNNTYQILIPAITMGCLLDADSRRKVPWLTLAAFVVSFLQIAIMRSMTTFFALVCLGALLLLIQKKPLRRVLNGATYLVLSIVAFVAVVILRLENIIGFFVVNVLGKSLTLSGRTDIWDMVMALMDQEHALWGYGLSGYKLFAHEGYAHAHNEFMNVWFVGGFVGLVLFAGILLVTTCCLFKYRQHVVTAIFAAALASFFMIGITEQITTPAFFFICSFALFVNPSIELQLFSRTAKS